MICVETAEQFKLVFLVIGGTLGYHYVLLEGDLVPQNNCTTLS